MSISAYIHGVDEFEHVFVADVLQPESLELVPLAPQQTLAGQQVLLQPPDLLLGVFRHTHTHTISSACFCSRLTSDAVVYLFKCVECTVQLVLVLCKRYIHYVYTVCIVQWIKKTLTPTERERGGGGGGGGSEGRRWKKRDRGRTER